jgi:hypothetical protein
MSSTVFSIVSAAPSWYVKSSLGLSIDSNMSTPFVVVGTPGGYPPSARRNRHPIGALASRSGRLNVLR